MLHIVNTVLEGTHVVLRPPLYNDLQGLCDAASDGEIWKNPYASFPSLASMLNYLQNLINHDHTILPFIITNKNSNNIVGTTRFLNINHQNLKMEIGHTWIAKSYRQPGINTESKLLMLQNAFEKLNCIVVEIRTDVLNQISRKAIERLGAKQDGILRNHKIMRDGKNRNTVCYSITRGEWPDVKENLLEKLASNSKMQ